MNIRWHQRLIVRIGAAILLIEIVALTLMGVWFTRDYGRQLDEKQTDRLLIPGRMMAAGLMNFDAIQDRALLEKLLGEQLLEAVIFGGTGVVFNSLNPDRLQQDAFSFVEFTRNQINSSLNEGLMLHLGSGGDSVAVHLQPIKTAGGQATFAYLYLKVSNKLVDAEKAAVARRFVLGSIGTILMTTVALLLVFNAQVGRRLGRLLEVANQVESGRMEARVWQPASFNEIELLGRDINTMLDTMQERERRVQTLNRFQQAMLDNAGYAIISTDLKGVILTFNRAAEEMLGYTADEMVGVRTPECFHDPEEVRQRALDFSAELGETVRPGFDVFTAKSLRGRPNEHEWIYVRKDGSRVPVLLKVTVVWNELDEASGFLGIAVDISERKRRRQEFEQLSSVIEATSDFVGLSDSQGMTLYVNRAGRKLVGIAADESLAGVPMASFHPKKFHQQVLEPVVANLQGAGYWSGESLLLARDGTEIPVSQVVVSHANERGEVIRYSTIIRDIRDIKSAERDLRTSRARLESAQSLARLGSWEHDLATGRTTWSREMFELHQLPPDGPIPRTRTDFLRLIHPEDRPHVERIHRQVRAITSALNCDYRSDPELGELKHLSARVYAVRDGQGRVTAIAGTVQDITERKVAELALQESEEKYRLVVGALAEGVTVLDLKGTIITSNRSAERILGLTQDQLLGKTNFDPDWRTIHEDGSPFPVEDHPVAWTIRTGESLSGIIMGVHKPGGELTWISINSSPLIRDGKPYAVVASFFDVSDQKRFRESLVERAQLLELDSEVSRIISGSRSLPEVLDLCCRSVVSHLNLAFCRIWLLDPPQETLMLRASAGIYTHLDGKHSRIRMGMLKIGRIARDRKAMLLNGVQGDTEISDRDWARRENMVSFCGYPLIAGGNLLGVMGMFNRQPTSQVTFDALGLMADRISLGIIRKQSEEEIYRLNSDLERRVEERTRELARRIDEVEGLNRSMINLLEDLQESRQEAERSAQKLVASNLQLASANKELESFSYSVSHDLRAPLRNVAGFVDLLRKRLDSNIDETIRRYMLVIKDETHRMGVLIDDLLGLSRLGRANLKMEPVNMEDLVDDIITGMGADEDGRVFQWTRRDLPFGYGDLGLLRQVWVNLIHNAVKYSRGRNPSEIEIGVTETGEPGQVVYFVRDNGVGFDMKYAEKLFGVFQRLHSAAEFEGTGIGLANVQRIITRHGGRVWAESRPGHGAIFYFALPVPPG